MKKLLFIVVALLCVGGCQTNPREICVTLSAELVYNPNIEPEHKEAVMLDGNYGASFANFGISPVGMRTKCVRTDIITIPEGKMWVFEKHETKNNGMVGPYIMEGENAYNCERDANNTPTFRSGQQIYIRASPKNISGRKWSIQSKIYFIEKDDDMYVQ